MSPPLCCSFCPEHPSVSLAHAWEQALHPTTKILLYSLRWAASPAGFPLTTYQVSRTEKHIVQRDLQRCTSDRQSSHSCLAPCTCPRASTPPEQQNSCSCAVSAVTALRLESPCKVGQPLPQLKITSFTEAGFRTVIKGKEKKKGEWEKKPQPYLLRVYNRGWCKKRPRRQ